MKILMTPKQGLKTQIKIVKSLMHTFDPQYLSYLHINLAFNLNRLKNCGILSSSYG